MHPTNCLNCERSLAANDHFCAACGQKAATHRLSLHDIGHDALHYVTHADKGIFHLLRELSLRPGKTVREYVEGKRVKYFKPVNFFLIVGAILVFMSTKLYMLEDPRVKQTEVAAARAKDPAGKKMLYGIAKRGKQVSFYMGRYANVIQMLGTPFFAFIYFLFYKKARYSFLEHVVANMYYNSFTMLVFALLIIPARHVLQGYGLATSILLSYFVVEVIYRSVAYYRFIGKTGALQAVKAFGVSIFVVLLWVMGSNYLISLYVRYGLWL